MVATAVAMQDDNDRRIPRRFAEHETNAARVLRERSERQLEEARENAGRRRSLDDWVSLFVDRFDLIPLGKLKVDPERQRQLRPSWVADKTSSFDAQLLLPVMVVKRRDGNFYVVDGQHRAQLVRAIVRDDDDYLFPCVVLPYQSVKEEAKAFLAQNTYSRQASAAETHHVRLQSGDARALKARDLILSAGLTPNVDPQGKVTSGHGVVTVTVVEGMLRQYAREDIPESTLRIIYTAYGRDHSVKSSFVAALARFLSAYDKHENYRESRLVDVIKGHQPDEILSAGSKHKMAFTGMSVQSSIASALVTLYNHKRQLSNKLPPMT